VRGEGSRGGWRHKEGEYGFGGDSFIWGFFFDERRFWGELGGLI
jgi:hypothetical protein